MGNRGVVFVGGGSAGHVFPGLAVADSLGRAWPGRIVWIGSRTGAEKRWLASSPIPYYGIPSGKWRRYFSVRNLLDVFKVLAGFGHALLLLIREQPALLFSKGGYVSVPPVVAAWILKIPVFTHESDYDPGLATRINARFAEKVLTSFAETGGFFGNKLQQKVAFIGNPVRRSFFSGDPEEGKRIIRCPPSRRVILVLGGSQGARSINRFASDMAPELTKKHFLVHQTGQQDFTPSNNAFYFKAPF